LLLPVGREPEVRSATPQKRKPAAQRFWPVERMPLAAVRSPAPKKHSPFGLCLFCFFRSDENRRFDPRHLKNASLRRSGFWPVERMPPAAVRSPGRFLKATLLCTQEKRGPQPSLFDSISREQSNRKLFFPCSTSTSVDPQIGQHAGTSVSENRSIATSAPCLFGLCFPAFSPHSSFSRQPRKNATP